VIKKLFSWLNKNDATAVTTSEDASNPLNAHRIPRDKHPISRKDISPNALKVLYRLKDNGYDAYLVGGCIRDILLGLEPKDFDVVTNATPEQIKACFNNCRLIGRRFRLAHIMFGREIIEVATFRGHHDDEASNQVKVSKQSSEGQLLRDNVFGTIEEDAERRDFTINAIYYSINDFALYDFANGLEDIKNGTIDLIGDPEVRYREDPVRMLRAVRFSNKLNMVIAPHTREPIFELGHLLTNIPPARLFDESLKLFLSGQAKANFETLLELGLFKYYFPAVQQVLTGRANDKEQRLIELMFDSTDQRINDDKTVSPSFIYAALFWYPVEQHAQDLQLEGGLSPYDAFQLSMSDVLHRAVQSVAIPKRFSSGMRDIWQFQHRLLKARGKKAAQMLEHPKFRAGYDFLVLRAKVEGGELEEAAQWWTDFQAAGGNAGPSRSKPQNKRRRTRSKFKGKRPNSAQQKQAK
jgi:poly(A) polymerase